MKKSTLVYFLIMIMLTLGGCSDDSSGGQEVEILNSDFTTKQVIEISEEGNYLGSSFDNPIVVTEEDPFLGVQWQNEWLEKNACSENGGYAGLKIQSLQTRNDIHYDVMKSNCNDGTIIDYYFLIDSFFVNY